MRKEERYKGVLNWFNENVPVAETELHYDNPYQLLIAVILSAQCTDKRVNMITPALFEDFPTAEVMAASTPEVIFEYRKSKTYDDCVRGTRNIWKVFGLSDVQYDYSMKMIPDSCIKEVIDESYRGKRPKGELSIWIYLLRYERHAIYPHTTLGYFMDAIHVIVNKMNGGDVDSYEPTCIYKLLDSLDYKMIA